MRDVLGEEFFAGSRAIATAAVEFALREAMPAYEVPRLAVLMFIVLPWVIFFFLPVRRYADLLVRAATHLAVDALDRTLSSVHVAYGTVVASYDGHFTCGGGVTGVCGFTYMTTASMGPL